MTRTTRLSSKHLTQTKMTMKQAHLESPPHSHPNPIENQPLIYLKYLENSIMKAKPRKNKSNISTTEREAIISLRKYKNIVIFEADKRGAVVIMNKSDYINEARKHLNSVDADGNRIYKELSYDCTEKFVRDVAEAIGKAAINKVIDDDLADLLLVGSPKAGNIYFLPKIHKEIQPPPGRPICNTINTPTMNLSKWVDMQLQPLVKKPPSYLKDDNDFLRKIDNLNKTQTIPPNAILVTWDVKSLYTNIPHKEGLDALQKTLEYVLRRICSTDELFSLRTKEMKQHLLNRGYTKGCINDAINKASTVTREDSLKENIEQKKLQRVPFVITYNPILPSIPKPLKKSHTILEASEKCTEIFKYIPLVSYRRGRNLSDMLCSKRMPPQTKKTQIVTTRTRKKMSHNSNQTNALSVVSPLKTKKVLKSTAPPNIDENKMLQHPLDSGLVTQTHDAKHAKKDSFIQPSPAQKTAKNIKLNSH